MLSWLCKVILISGPDFCLARRFSGWHTMHTNHFHLPPFWEHVSNKWHSNSFITCLLSSSIRVQPLQTLCRFNTKYSISNLLLSLIQFKTNLCPGRDPNPTPQKCSCSCRTASPAGLFPALLGRWRTTVFSLFADLVRLWEAWNADTAEVKAARNKVSRKMA